MLACYLLLNQEITMERPKRWQFYLILAVIALTIYNILPTIFYYSNPLRSPIGPNQAEKVASDIVERVNDLEGFTLSWLKAQTKNLGLKATKISLDADDPRLARVEFKSPQDAAFFATTLQRAGALIPFIPAQLSPMPGEDSKTVLVQRRVGIHLDPAQLNKYFHYVAKTDANGDVSANYQRLISERAAQVALGFGGTSEPARILSQISADQADIDSVIRLARSIVDYETAFGDQNPITKRYFATFTQTKATDNNKALVQKFAARLEKITEELNTRIKKIKEEQATLQKDGKFLDSNQKQALEVFESQKNTIAAASSIVRRNAASFEAGEKPLTQEEIFKQLLSSKVRPDTTQVINLGKRNPFISKLEIDWNRDTINVVLHPDAEALRTKTTTTEAGAIQSEKLNQLLFNEIARAARSSEEKISPSHTHFVISLNKVTNSTSLLAFDFAALAKTQTETLERTLKTHWNPTSDLSHTNYPIYDYAQFSKLSPQEQKLALVVYAPVLENKIPEGFRKGSIYVIARGASLIRQKYQDLSDSPQKIAFEKDFRSLYEILRENGFISYAGSSSELPAEFKNDYIFELSDYYSYLLAATREDFSVTGGKQFGILEFTDGEQRLLTQNKIETSIHEDLVKWRDEYEQARVAVDPKARYDVPKPTESVLLSNLKLSAAKYFRGDDRKILKWGLDLSGGKTVRIGLRDQNNQPIDDELDLKQAVNELYQRVNRLGVSEVGIRTEGSTIVLDFPGSQGLSGSDLIQASAMYFHVVNEKFTANNPILAEAVNTFLEEVWNEAVITNRTDSDSLNEIAWQHLGGTPENPEEFRPLSSHGRLLYDNGLRFAPPKSQMRSSAFNDTLSSIALFRGNDYADWEGQTYPLLIVFRNYALEGANLTDVNTGYDPAAGNTLYFGVSGPYVTREGDKVNPRDDFYAWTSQFAEEKIVGTPKEQFSRGRGWRMAVILNGTVISSPALNSPLRESAQITGHFSQREINQLAADLKAGSLSFTPHILSEENVSPDLGKEQRNQGIMAGLLGILLVAVTMCVIYRFAGLVATIAVLFNLLIIWGVLQNLGAALTLPGIAGIILAVGMSVDANVLVFERIREEFALSKRLPSAIAAGYRKAFTAIVDSNLTTIIAALILLNFDSGPIKGFALTLIIGIVSSMFTSLFMTRFFFANWVQNPAHKELKMIPLFANTKFNFLSKARLAFIVSAVLIVAGGFFLVKEKATIFGMDFTGGYALTLDLKEKPNTNYRLQAEEALVKEGASKSDFIIQELNKPNQLRLQLGISMERPGKPFHDLNKSLPAGEETLFTYQEYPQIVWIVNALEKHGLEVNPASLPTLNLHWTEMSGQLSETMRNQALIGLGLALLCILIYITFRFEFKYAISATIGLVHDILITLGVLALFHYFNEGMRIDLQVIAALMTIIGYSLNDTIIIFDRIREDLRVMRKQSFAEIVNHALNATLSRTLMTSSTTLLVLLALVLFGGSSIFNFSFIMMIGIAIGTLSSLFIAAPLLLYFHRREEVKEDASKKSIV